MNNPLLNILNLLLIKSNYNISKRQLSLQLLSHPDYLTARSVTETLEYFIIKHIAAVVPKETFIQLPEIFIAQIINNGNSSFVFIEKKQDKIFMYTNEKESKNINQDDFFDIWTGMIVAVEKSSSETSYLKIIHRFKDISLIVIIIMSLIYVGYTYENLYLIAYYFGSIIGCLISIYIIKAEIGFDSHFTQNICQLNSNTSCNDVFNSKTGRLFKNTKLSDLSLIYFTTLIICNLIFGGLGGGVTPILFCSSCFGLPILIYSIFAQWKIVKKWCPLCLGISGILGIQFFILLANREFEETQFLTNVFEYRTLVFISIAMSCALTWSYLKPILKTSVEIHTLRIENLKFNRNHHLFLPYYLNLKSINTIIESTPDIAVGVVTNLTVNMD